ncbi:MAG TPA: hypothetical protein VNJ52_10430, partial [Patescibacteria group bacterium]|nr:hypothetical protein [Patescibacteria group bacterium]
MRRFPTILSVLCAAILLALTAPAARAQADPNLETGLKPYGSYSGGKIDTIALMNGSLAVDIPLISYPQKGGKLALKFVLHYENRGSYLDRLYVTGSNGKKYYYYDGPTELGHGFNIIQAGVPVGGYFSDFLFRTPYWEWQTSAAIQMSDGPVYTVIPKTTIDDWGSGDGMGYDATLAVDDGGSGIMSQIIGPDGTKYGANAGVIPGPSRPSLNYAGGTYYYIPDLPGVPSVIEDTNGNKITYSDPSGAGWTDTMGRTIPNPATTSTSSCPQQPQVPLAPTSAWLWTLPGVNGVSYPILFCSVTITEELEQPYGSGFQLTTYQATELQNVVFENDGTSWTFEYDTAGKTGDLLKIIFPTGGSISYVWTAGQPIVGTHAYVNLRAIASRTVDDGTDPPATTTYSYTGPTFSPPYEPRVTTVTDPYGNQTVYTFGSASSDGYAASGVQYYQCTANCTSSTPSEALLKTVGTSDFSPVFSGTYYGRQVNLPSQVTTTWAATNQENETSYSYDVAMTTNNPVFYSSGSGLPSYFFNPSPAQWTYGLRESTSRYDYGPGAPGSLVRTTTTGYVALGISSYLNANMLDLRSYVQVTDGGGTQRAVTDYLYDQSPNPNCTCGNLTWTDRWLNTNSSELDSETIYNSSGELITSKDADGNATNYAYGSGYAGSGPTSVTNTLNQTTNYTYDANTGLETSVEDPNNQTTSYQYDDMLRTTQVDYPDGGQTLFSYPDPTHVQIAEKIDASGHQKTWTLVVDGLGRKIQTQLTSDPEGTDYVDTTYDDMGRVASVSNPYRSASDPTYGVTSYAYDALGRMTKVTKQDGSTINTDYTNFPCTTVTDEAGKTRESCVDGLGRLATVIENPGGSPSYTTTYAYDALDNLTGVNDDGQTRSFVYDSLSRLASATNPESGTTTYAYDANSNVATRTDARNITTTYSYDALNRFTQKSYSDGTPTATYSYDQASCLGQPACYNIGRRTGATNAAGAEAWAYDPMGRTIAESQCTSTNCGSSTWTTTYQYNLLGETKEYTKPSGVQFSYGIDTAGHVTQLTSSASDPNQPGTLVSNVSYNAPGDMTAAMLGNGLTETAVYNS